MCDDVIRCSYSYVAANNGIFHALSGLQTYRDNSDFQHFFHRPSRQFLSRTRSSLISSLPMKIQKIILKTLKGARAAATKNSPKEGTGIGLPSNAAAIKKLNHFDHNHHKPVMLKEVVALIKMHREKSLFSQITTDSIAKLLAKHELHIQDGSYNEAAPEKYTIVDATFGWGGYSCGILDSLVHDKSVNIIGVDCDPLAYKRALDLKNSSKDYKDRLEPLLSRFSDAIEEMANRKDGEKVDVVLLDLGVSSMQLDDGARGFSFMRNGELDMRMTSDPHKLLEINQSSHNISAHTTPERTAKYVVNNYSAAALERLISVYGEERHARKIANSIIQARHQKHINGQEIQTTADLAEIIVQAVGWPTPSKIKSKKGKKPHHPATKTFQALRIHVNRELEELWRALRACRRVMKKCGLVVVVSFHSLEDRLVKKVMNGIDADNNDFECNDYLVESRNLLQTDIDKLEKANRAVQPPWFGGAEERVMQLVKADPYIHTRMRWRKLDEEMLREKSEESGPVNDEEVDYDFDFREYSDHGLKESDSGIMQSLHESSFIMISKKPCIPREEEVKKNPRSRSAKLRPYVSI